MFERRMKVRALAGALAALVTMAASNAWAAVCTTSKTLTNQTCTSWRSTSSGVRYCSLWCTGSEICDNVIYGLGGNVVKECVEGENCPVTSCSAFGTQPIAGSSGTCDTNLNTLNATCGIPGKLACSDADTDCPSGGECDEGEGPDDNGDEFIVLDEALDFTSDTLICDKKGKCTNTLRLLPEDTADLCPGDTEFVTFTASEFKARSCFCPGGFAGETCCADSSRTDGGCSKKYAEGLATEGTPTCMVALCTVDLSDFDPEVNFNLPYDCHPSGALECGGVTGTVCPAS